MINISSLSKQFGPQVLFEGVTLQLNPRERYGLVGANGSGKSTFLKILIGDEGSDGGEITFGKQLRLGVLRQDHFQNDALRILDVAMAGDEEVSSALAELDRLSEQEAPDAALIADLNETIARQDGYTLEARSREILVGLGIAPGQIEQPLSTLSGGFKLRVLLAQVLVGRPDVLLLDEPTNHLDILSIHWLEQFLASFPGCAVVISHDRHFLDSVVTHILDVDYQTITDYPGNYASFVTTKELTQSQKQAQADRAEKIIAEKKAFVERFKAKATKARQAQSRVKQIEKIEVVEVAKTSRRAPNFRFDQIRPTGKDVLKVEQISRAYGEKQVLTDVSFDVRRGEKIALIGENGIGKSTLLKIISDNLEADQGSFEWGIHAKLGYFAQDHHDLLSDPKQTPLEFVWNAVPAQPVSYVRGQLGRMLFSGDEVEKKVTALSGGEAARVIFALLSVQQPNILILDEPTNHLDLEAIEALAEALRKYEGTLLFVSHDRWFVSQIAERIIELKRDGIHDFSGTYDEYLEKAGEDHLDQKAVSLKAKSEKKEGKTDKSGAKGPRQPELSRDERKKRANRRKALPKKRDELMREIDKREIDKQKIHERYEDPQFFMNTPNDEIERIAARQKRVESELARLMKEWEEIEEELAELEAP